MKTIEELMFNIVKEVDVYDENNEPVLDEEGNCLTQPNPSWDEILDARLRLLRKKECFEYINRGSLWYDTLSQDQQDELQVWYKEWLDVTKTHVIPETPKWLE